ncbi:hypothetical protein [Citrobacter braakii]|uniref:hypothetical protein n=1 Tax=Citrobacter braakii TaxID=57706 RepID=UPI00397598F8
MSRLLSLPGIKTLTRYLIAGVAGGGTACLSVLVFILFYQVKNTGSAADWIASLANASMAVTAVLAFMVARSWLPQLTTQEGYKLAIELVNDHYIWLGMQNSVLTDVTLPVRYIQHQVDRESMTGLSEVSSGELINALEQAVLLHKTRRDKMVQIRLRLSTYGLRVTRAYADRFLALDTAYMHASDAAASILQTLKKTHELSKNFPSNDSALYVKGELTRELYVPLLREASERFMVVNEQFQQMVKIHDAIFSCHPSIGKLFEVKR